MFLALTQFQEVAVEVASVPAIFVLLVALGRRLKRKHGVRLGVIYLLFSIAFSMYVPLWVLVSTGKMGPRGSAQVQQATPSPDLPPEMQVIDQRLKQIQASMGPGTGKDGTVGGKGAGVIRTPIQEVLRLLGALVTLLGALVVISLMRCFFWEM